MLLDGHLYLFISKKRVFIDFLLMFLSKVGCYVQAVEISRCKRL